MILHWFLSKTVRQATAMRRHVHKILRAQQDILSPQAISATTEAMESLQKAIAENAGKASLQKEMENLEKVANKWLKPYPHAAWRENVEVLLVALAVAMGIRTFFLQPFKIPTGSMQPTLFGITHENLINEPDLKMPNLLTSLYEYWVRGISYKHVVAKADGSLENYDSAPKHFLLFNLSQSFMIGGQSYKVWFPPDRLLERAGLVDPYGRHTTKVFHAGEDVIKLKVFSGDHLFVDRLTYNFRHPRRGEIIVFETKGIEYPGVPQDQFYIKRLIALGGEKVQIGNDQHLIINGKRLDASTSRFENIYSFKPNAGDNEYFGHTQVGRFSDATQEYELRPNHYMVMGDNTRNSLDSRYFGDFSREYVIGKSCFVYWPITERFGWGYR